MTGFARQPRDRAGSITTGNRPGFFAAEPTTGGTHGNSGESAIPKETERIGEERQTTKEGGTAGTKETRQGRLG